MTRARSLFGPSLAWIALLAVLAEGARCSDAADGQRQQRPLVISVPLQNESINPITMRHLQRVIEQGQRQGAECVVILLDTPGGLVDSTSAIVKQILNSRVCVVVYVAPQGARAASAGGFLLLSAHVAAMSPGTRVGAMHPVQIGGLPISPPQPASEPEGEPGDERPETSRRLPAAEQKTVNDTIAWARSLAELRQRNVDWAEQAVRESVVATEQEALQQRIIDLIAADLDELLEQLDGRQLQVRDATVTLQTADAEVRTIQMWWGDRILATLASPNVAFLLLIFGFYGILFEFYSPGWGVAGMAGVLCLVLAFMGLAVLPVNYVGLALIFVALAMLVAEALVPSFGLLTLGGVISLVAGALMLVESPEGFLHVSLAVVLPVAAATALITVLLVSGIVRAHRGHVQTGTEGMTGSPAVAAGEFVAEGDRFVGTVHVHGELWQAVSAVPVTAGQRVTVQRRDGLTLFVSGP